MVKKNVTTDRMLELMKNPENPQATDIEVINYYSTQSLDHPLSHDSYEIYMHVFKRWQKKRGMNIPDFLKKDIELNDLQKTELKHLKKWLFKKSFEALKQKLKDIENHPKETKEMI